MPVQPPPPEGARRGGYLVGGGRSCVSPSGLHVHVCLSAVPVIVRHDCVLVFSLFRSPFYISVSVSPFESREHRLVISLISVRAEPLR